MLRNRLLYLFILLCSTAFFICFNGYYSWYVFLLTLALPWMSLIISLPGMLTGRVFVETPEQSGTARTSKSASVPIEVAASSLWPLPWGRVRAWLDIENSLTGERRREIIELSPGRRPQKAEQKLSSRFCGRVICRIARARAYDLLGLFWLPLRLKRGRDCQVIVYPGVYEVTVDMAPLHAPDADSDRYSPTRPGSDPTELFGLREYRPGDKLSRVDWKLSQKTGDMLVREGSLPVAKRALLLVDLSGDREELDLIMDTLATLGQSLSRQEAQYTVGFPRGRELEFVDVDDPSMCAPALEAVLCNGSRGTFPAAMDSPAPGDVARVAYLCPSPQRAALELIDGLYPQARLTVIYVRPPEGEGPLPGRQVRQGSLAADLEGITL